jgi:signal transduction histidine kinase/ligand-binding sensor domain-containing protein
MLENWRSSVTRCLVWLFTVIPLYAFPQSGQPIARLPLATPLTLIEGDDIRFTRLSTPEGLSQSRVEHIVQDDQGFMWFGTEDGLDRYDGYAVKVFRHDGTPNSLSGATIRALFKDRSGKLWIGVDQFLDRFDPETEAFTHYGQGQSNSTSLGGIVFSICQDRVGMLWLATNRGLDKLDPGTGRFTHYMRNPKDPTSLNSNDLSFVMEGRGGTLWIVSSIGLDALDPRTDRFTHYLRFERPELLNALRPDIRLYEDRSGVLWLSSVSSDELTMFDPKAHTLARYSLHEPGRTGVTSIIEDEEGFLWVGGYGLTRLDRKHSTFTQYRKKPGVSHSLSNDFVLSLFEDREGSIWVGTGGGGVARFFRKPLPFRTYQKEPDNRNSLDQDYVLTVYEDSKGVLWIGNDNVLNGIDRKTGRYLFYRHNPADSGSISSGSVISIIEDYRGYLWFGTYGAGLNRFDRGSGRFKAYRNNSADPHSLSSDHVFALFIDRAGTLWAGTGDGLNRLDLKTEHFTVFREDVLGSVNRIVEDRDRTLWIGTSDRGLNRFDPATGHFAAYRHNFHDAASLSNDRVNALCIDGTDSLWVGTQDGLDKFDLRTHRFTAVYFEKDGLPSNAVQGIEEDAEGHLWVSTNNGLSRFDPRANTFSNFYDSDGIAGNDFGVFFPASFKSPSGELFFGGVDGVTAFYPDKLDKFQNPYVPPVVLTDFRLNNNRVPIGRDSVLKKAISHITSVTLSHEQNSFSLEFSALSYFSPPRNRYRYKLEGLDNEWHDVGSDRRYVTYTTLPPRSYTFRVQGSNNFGTWNEVGTDLGILIMPPWWSTWWFRVTCGVCVLVLAWSAHRYRLHQLADQFNVRFEVRVGERTRIARDLHDTLLQGFQGLMLRLQVVEDLLPPGEAKEELAQTLQRADEAIAESRSAISDLRLPTIITNDLAEAVKALGEELATGDAVAFRLVVGGQARELHPVIRDELYRIACEALRNAFSHARARQVETEIAYGQLLRLRIRDDGVGIPPATLEEGRSGHYGLPGMRERAAQIGGKLTIWSELGAGTEIDLSVPGSIAYSRSLGRSRLGLLRPKGRMKF